MEDKEIQDMQIRICNTCKQYKKCDNELCTMSELVAKELSKFYQPKIGENSVVITKEEYYKLKETIIDLKCDKLDLRNEIIEKENRIALLEEGIDGLADCLLKI